MIQGYYWDEVPEHEVDGRHIRVVGGVKTTVMRQIFPADMTFALRHTHHQEQISTVLRGRARFTCGDKSVELGPGGTVILPANIEHETAKVGDEEMEIQEIFAPVHERLDKLAPPH
ncbi:MAG: cupin domain-containing protein [bacterium]|nr:cupin domain-containing protein [bacterium]